MYKHKYLECIATTAICLFKLCKQIVELCLESCVNSTILFGQQTMAQAEPIPFLPCCHYIVNGLVSRIRKLQLNDDWCVWDGF